MTGILAGLVGSCHPISDFQAVVARSEADETIHVPASGIVDCFAEPVIGRAFARPVGSQ
jgi:hypothetical protein